MSGFSYTFVRDLGDKVIVVSIVDKEDMPESFSGEHMYFTSNGHANSPTIWQFSLHSERDYGKDISNVSVGNSVDGILQLPIWRN